ncbi:hypothetical protein ACIP5L_33215 [Streptomyces bacillaris]|uniref:hypothetical protein n=1 Tax=Streptomyces bacillaris TaxID=68179 RepID=UPI00381DBAD4
MASPETIRRRERAIVVTSITVASIILLVAAGIWVYGVRAMSHPVSPSLLGARIDGDTVTVKAAQCPQDRVRRVEVRDAETGRLLWYGDRPLTEEALHGVVPLWDGKGYRYSGPAGRPSELPPEFEVVVDQDPDSGAVEWFETAKIRAAAPPPGSYWTPGGIKTAAELDAVLECGSDDGGGSGDGDGDGERP